MTDKEVFAKLQALRAEGVGGSLATIVRVSGSTPRDTGAKMIVCADGSIYGTVGGGCGENQVRSAALRARLGSGVAEMVEVDLTDELGTRGAAVCGGTMWIFVEPF